MSTVVSTLVLIQQNFIVYGFPIILGLGNIGNLICVAVFMQKHHRQSATSLYLLAAAIFSLIGVNWGVATNMSAVYRPPDVFTLSLALCRIRGYILQTSSLLYRMMIVLACASRAVSSSIRFATSGFNKPKTTLIIIGITALFWLVVSIHLPIFEDIRSGHCAIFGDYKLFFTIYLICILGVIFPGLMIIFSIIILKNLKASRRRVRPQEETSSPSQQILNKRDQNLLKLLFTEVVTGIILTFLYPIGLLYAVLSANVPNKSQERIQIEAFMTFMSQIVLFYLNYSITFYVYVMASKPFRNEVKRLFLKYLHRLGADQTHTQVIPTNNRTL